MLCRECGENIPDDSVYCPECGKLPGGVPSPPQWPPGQAPRAAAGPPTGAVPNYLVQSIVVTLLCCLPAGIVAIVNASKANTKGASGDYEGAAQAARNAKMWCWVAVAGGVIVAVVYFSMALTDSGSGDF